ncbi:MAG: hypothetical protein IAF38_14535 [Bacteroidia bacterium]|nr:hypothetical protein [Bacteroidia bacterium]
MARFQIEDIFKITGRGIVLAGKIIEGEINTGDIIELKINGEIKTRQICGLEMFGRTMDTSKFAVLIRTESEEEVIELRAWQHNNFTAEIIPAVKS